MHTLLRKIVPICVHYCGNSSFDLLNSLTKNPIPIGNFCFYCRLVWRRDVSEFIFDYLRENTKTNMLYKPNQAEFDRYWQPESLIITDLTSEAPMNTDSPHEITAEKMLVDIFCDKIINLTYGKSEYKSVVDEIYSRYQVDTARLLRYARRRNKEKEIMQFIDGK